MREKIKRGCVCMTETKVGREGRCGREKNEITDLCGNGKGRGRMWRKLWIEKI